MPALYKVLDDLGYIIECLAQDLTGEAKHQLTLLRQNIERNELYALYDKDRVTQVLQDSRKLLLDMNKADCTFQLCMLSRLLWSAAE
jgi:hypothetical protein